MHSTPRHPFLPVLLLFLSSQLFLAGCEEKGPFGLSQERFTQVLATKNSAAIISLPDSALDSAGPLGAPTWYYTARWLDDLVPAGTAEPSGSSVTPGTNAGPETAEPAPGKGSSQEDIPPALVDVGARDGVAVTAASAPRARVRALYRLAFERGSGLISREAGLRLVAAAGEDARFARKNGSAKQANTLWNEVLAESQAFGDRLGPDASVRLARLEALDALGRDAELVRECAEFRSLFPAADYSDALMYYEGASAERLGKKLWAPALYALLVVRPTSDWTAKTLDFLTGLGASQTDIDGEVLVAARMRLLVRNRDYGAAWKAALAAKALVLSASAPSGLVADAGKACLYSGSSKDGLALFESAFGAWPEGSPAKRGSEELASAWTANYYRARFLRALEKWPEAARLFSLMAQGATTPEDGDAASWYAIDCGMKAATAAQKAKYGPKKASEETLKARAASLRQTCLELMIEGSSAWKDPSVFSDLADSLLRQGISDRDWAFVGDFARRLGPHLSPTLDARAAYIAGRALELGLDRKPAAKLATSKKGGSSPAKPGPSSSKAATSVDADPAFDGPSAVPSAASYYLAAAGRSGAPAYYRVLALRRLGEEPEVLPPPDPSPAPASTPKAGATGAPEPGAETEAFLKGFIDLGITSFIFPELKDRPFLDAAALRRLAHEAADKGDIASSMRIILGLAERPDWVPTRGDYELLYPRPFIDEIRALRPRPNVPEYILYGLLRSESFFRPDVVSSAGAVGLAQLMPSTAEQIARGLGMDNYDLTHPSDNIRMGSAHFADLIDGTGNRPMRAMFAYNAGGGRLKRWLADYPGLPDDILLESLPIEETRQYGRNILQAAVFYAELYYDMSGKEAVDGVLAAGALPPPK